MDTCLGVGFHPIESCFYITYHGLQAIQPFQEFKNLSFHVAILIYYTQANSVSNKNLSSIGIQLSKLSYYQLIKLEFRNNPSALSCNRVVQYEQAVNFTLFVGFNNVFRNLALLQLLTLGK